MRQAEENGGQAQWVAAQQARIDAPPERLDEGPERAHGHHAVLLPGHELGEGLAEHQVVEVRVGPGVGPEGGAEGG